MNRAGVLFTNGENNSAVLRWTHGRRQLARQVRLSVLPGLGHIDPQKSSGVYILAGEGMEASALPIHLKLSSPPPTVLPSTPAATTRHLNRFFRTRSRGVMSQRREAT